MEKEKALKATKDAIPGQGSVETSGVMKEGQGGKGSSNAQRGKDTESPKQKGRSGLGGKAESPRKP